ncbi:hypothetical protein [Rhizobium sp. FKY42]|uniref:hypothetical protein n=1 Tax=Rhizobium sp. FKY42 TaxID=2562310 RepID=UPI001484FA06|nr:hypothetical protein [Rhizobium sp. FKY42]
MVVSKLSTSGVGSGSSSASSATSDAGTTSTGGGGRIIGYDKNFNPITEVAARAQIPPNKLEQQTVDQAESSKSISALMKTITGSERINQEFFAYLNDKYGKTSRPPDGMDVYKNPQNYTAEQKLGRYVDLVNLKAQYDAYSEARLQENTGEMATILVEPEVKKDIQQGMETLLEDPTVSGLLTSEYLKATGEILNGKRFQTDESKYDKAYTDAVEKLRTDIQTQFKADIVDGGIFKDGIARGINERTVLTNYNSALTGFASVLPAAYIEQHQTAIDASYNQYYTSNVEPLLPDAAGGQTAMINAFALSLQLPDSLRNNVGLVTPTIDGKTYVDSGLALKTDKLVDRLSAVKVDADTAAQMKALGLSAKIPQDGFTASFLPTVTNMATQVYGSSDAAKAKRTEFTSQVLEQLRPLVTKLDGGFTDATLNTALADITRTVSARSNPLSSDAAAVTTALNGLVRGANLTGNKLLDGMYRAGSGYDIRQVQALTALAVGYEGKGIAQGAHPMDASLVPRDFKPADTAIKVFGTEGRKWDSEVLKQFGYDTLKPMSSKMSEELQRLLPNADVQKPVFDLLSEGQKKYDEVLKTYADTVAKGLYGNDAKAIETFSGNLVRMVYNINSVIKPGGSLDKVYLLASQYAKDKGATFTGSVSIAEQEKVLAKTATLFLSAQRTIYSGILLGQNSTPEGIASQVLTTATATSHLMDYIGMSMKEIKYQKPLSESLIFMQFDEVAKGLAEKTRSALPKTASLLGAAVDIAWLPVDIFSFVQGLKAGKLDTVDKIFNGLIIGTDVGVAVDAGISMARTLIPAATLQASRFASLFFGAGGAITAGLGAAFNALNGLALIGLVIYQNFKTSAAFEKASKEIDANLSRFTDNTTRNYLKSYPSSGTPWENEEDKKKLREQHFANMYKHDITPFDWNAVRENNRKYYAASGGA